MNLEDLEKEIEEVFSEPIRVNPDADKRLEVSLNLTLVTGHSYAFTTQFVVYTYGQVPSPKHIHHKISGLPYLTSSDGKTMFKMNNVVSVEVLSIGEINENS